jgi:glucosyl-3-phosphoglycerate synthase
VSSTIQSPDIQRWFETRTYTDFRPEPGLLAEIKAAMNTTVSVCLPALNEAATIGAICEVICSELIDGTGLVDQLVVIDSGSIDHTADVARAAGADVRAAHEILPHVGSRTGKGEALWKSLAVLEGDVVVWLDSDTLNFEPAFVTNLIAPLLVDDTLVYTKGFYRRTSEPIPGAATGGRVTELVVRPLLHLLYPQLSKLVQPLSGEYAGRREALMRIPFFTGYAVEIGMLIDLVERFGLDSIAQVDLGTRLHRNRDTLELGKTSYEIMRALFVRLNESGAVDLDHLHTEAFVQFIDGPRGITPAPVDLTVERRPPMAQVLN